MCPCHNVIMHYHVYVNIGLELRQHFSIIPSWHYMRGMGTSTLAIGLKFGPERQCDFHQKWCIRGKSVGNWKLKINYLTPTNCISVWVWKIIANTNLDFWPQKSTGFQKLGMCIQMCIWNFQLNCQSKLKSPSWNHTVYTRPDRHKDEVNLLHHHH